MLTHILLVAAAYLLGSASTAIVSCRVLGLADPRGVGSGNPGATNVLRTGGRQAAVITLLGDVLKGFAPVIFVQALSLGGEAVLSAVALAAFCGHIYPVYYGFKGGKGVATALGVLLGMHALVGLCALMTWFAVASISRFASLASLLTGLLTPVYTMWLTGSAWLAGTTIVMAVLIFWRHRANIRALLAGSENTIGSKA